LLDGAFSLAKVAEHAFCLLEFLLHEEVGKGEVEHWVRGTLRRKFSMQGQRKLKER
jgi:hypothetical protein